MPLEELHFASGLAFSSIFKAGAGISISHGRGFVISKLPSDSNQTVPPYTWSAPFFIKANAAGIGLTIGYANIDSVVILDTPEAVKSFKSNVVEFDTEVTGAAGSAAGASLPATAVKISHNSLTDKEFTYALAEGALVDVSLNGVVYTVDDARNEAVYGQMASPAAILEGGVQAPAAMSPLYAAIDQAMKEFYLEQAEPRKSV
jgi:lipid-binding SYLF domain-containing protein